MRFSSMLALIFSSMWFICSISGLEYRINLQNHLDTKLVAICSDHGAKKSYESIGPEAFKPYKVKFFKLGMNVYFRCYLVQIHENITFMYVKELEFFNQDFVKACKSFHSPGEASDCGLLNDCYFTWNVHSTEVSGPCFNGKHLVYKNPWREDKDLVDFSHQFDLNSSKILELLV